MIEHPLSKSTGQPLVIETVQIRDRAEREKLQPVREGVQSGLGAVDRAAPMGDRVRPRLAGPTTRTSPAYLSSPTLTPYEREGYYSV